MNPQLWCLLPSLHQEVAHSLQAACDMRLGQAAYPTQSVTEARLSGPVLDITGPLTRYRSPETAALGWTTYEQLSQELSSLEASSHAEVFLRFDSGGGEARGVDDLAHQIKTLAKPTVAVIDGMCASAAYYLASQCNRIVASPSSLIGGIGTYGTLLEFSRQLDANGITPNIVSSNALKVSGHPYKAMTTEERQVIQRMVGEATARFERAVLQARRSVSIDEAFSGDVFPPQKAKQLGMIDDIDYASNVLPGNTRQRTSSKRSGQKQSSDSIGYFAKIRELQATGMSRSEATETVNKKFPQLRKQLVEAANK